MEFNFLEKELPRIWTFATLIAYLLSNTPVLLIFLLNVEIGCQLRGKIFGEDDRLVLEDSDLISISDKLRLVSIGQEVEEEEGRLIPIEGGDDEEKVENKATQEAGLAISDEELARMLQVSGCIFLSFEFFISFLFLTWLWHFMFYFILYFMVLLKRQKKKHLCFSSSLSVKIME